MFDDLLAQAIGLADAGETTDAFATSSRPTASGRRKRSENARVGG